MDSIIRGTNATIQIKIKEDIDFSQLSSVEMCIYQATKKIVKPQSDLILDADARTITYVTSQEESFSLAPNRNVEITAWGLLAGQAFETRPVVTAKVENSRRTEVIT